MLHEMGSRAVQDLHDTMADSNHSSSDSAWTVAWLGICPPEPAERYTDKQDGLTGPESEEGEEQAKARKY